MEPDSVRSRRLDSMSFGKVRHGEAMTHGVLLDRNNLIIGFDHNRSNTTLESWTFNLLKSNYSQDDIVAFLSVISQSIDVNLGPSTQAVLDSVAR
jgi:hypothetical protein